MATIRFVGNVYLGLDRRGETVVTTASDPARLQDGHRDHRLTGRTSRGIGRDDGEHWGSACHLARTVRRGVLDSHDAGWTVTTRASLGHDDLAECVGCQHSTRMVRSVREEAQGDAHKVGQICQMLDRHAPRAAFVGRDCFGAYSNCLGEIVL